MNPIKVRFNEKEAEKILKETVLSDGSKPVGQKRKDLQDILTGRKAVKA